MIRMELFVFSLFLLPFLVLRICLSSRSSWKLGVISDILIALQLTIVSCISEYLGFFLLGLAVPYTLFDHLLYRSTGIRMRFSMFYYFAQVKSFWGSAKDLGVFWFLGGAVTWLVAVGFFWWNIHCSLWLPESLLAAVLSIVCVLIFFKIPISERYGILHPLILEETEGLRRLFVKKKNETGKWRPSQEIYTAPSPKYPLFRCTKQFLGEKAFSIGSLEGKKPHIVFLILESFRAKSVRACNPKAPASLTPCFNKLAKEGVLWKNFYSVSARSFKALLASHYGVSSKKDDKIFQNLPRFPLRGLPEILKEQGYTNAFLQGGDLEFDRMRDFTKNHGFDLIEGMQEITARFQEKFQGSSWGLHDEYIMKRAVEVLKHADAKGTPLFMDVLTISNHHPWRIPPGEKETLHYPTQNPDEARFQTVLHYSDRCLGQFVQELEKEGLLEKTLLFIFGDHGQPFSERGDQSGMREGLYDELVHIPLLLLAKGRELQPKIVEEVASQLDLLPTMIDLLGISSFHHAMGRSLFRQNKEAVALFHSPFLPLQLGMRKQEWKWMCQVEGSEEELYNLSTDPQEKDNVAHAFPMVVKALREEAFARNALTEHLFEKRQMIPSETLEENPIDLSGQELTKQQLVEMLSKLPPTELCLDNCKNLDDEKMLAIAPFCKNLSRLSLRNCLQISSKALHQFFQETGEIDRLDLSHCLQLDEGLEQLFDKPTRLHRLYLDGLLQIDGAKIAALTKNTPSLQRLSLHDTKGCDDGAFEKIVQNCPQLRHLKIDASDITDKSLESLARHTPHLVGLHLMYGDHITDEGLALLKSCSNISSLTLRQCPKITGQFIKSWRHLFLDTLYLEDLPCLQNEFLDSLSLYPICELHMKQCPQIADSGIQRLAMLDAKKIHVVECEGVSRQAIDFLRTKVGMVYWA